MLDLVGEQAARAWLKFSLQLEMVEQENPDAANEDNDEEEEDDEGIDDEGRSTFIPVVFWCDSRQSYVCRAILAHVLHCNHVHPISQDGVPLNPDHVTAGVQEHLKDAIHGTLKLKRLLRPFAAFACIDLTIASAPRHGS